MNDSLHLLLLDDSPDYRLLIKHGLRQAFPDLQVTEIKDAQEFCQVLEQGQFDLVITDYQLRWTDGLKILRAIKEYYPECPVIMFTATGSEEVAIQAMKAGLDDYVIKSAKQLIRLPTAVRAVWKQVQQHKLLGATEAALRQAYTVIENSPVVIFRCRAEPDWPVEYVSPNIARFGYTAEDFLNGRLSYQALIHPADRARVIRESEALRAGGHDIVVEYRLLTKAGNICWIENRYLTERDSAGRITHYQGILLDITARKQAEEALQESEERYRLMVRATNDVIWDWDLLTDASIRSETLQTHFGYAPEEVGTRTGHTYQWWAAHIHPQERAAVATSLKAALTGPDDVWSAEYRFRKADDSYAMVLDRSYIIRNERDEPVRMVGSMLDITARKQAEEALQQAHVELEKRVQERTAELSETNRRLEQEIAERKQIEQALKESEERYRHTMDAALVGIYVIQDFLFDYVNPTMAQLFGYTPQEMIGKLSPMETVVPEQREQVRSRLIERAQGIAGTPLELKCLRKDGSHFDALIRSKATIYRGRPAIVGALIDITERKYAEAALAENQERFRQLAEHIREVFWINSADAQQVLYVSPAYQDIWGRSCESLYERPAAWVEAVHPEDRPRVQQARTRMAMTGEFEQEFRIVRPDGTIRWIRSRGFPIRDATGTIYRIVGIAEDITQRKEAEEQMRQQQAELAHMARLALAGEMASGLAHELNQPLGAIATYTQTCLLLIHSGQIMSEQLMETLEKVTAQAQRAGDIIHRLRDLVRKVDPHRDAIDINALLQEMVRLTEPEARQREIRIQLELVEDLPVVFADAIQLQQVVLNLMRNAIEAMTEAEAHLHELTLRTSPVGNEAIEVAISDTGPGLSPEAMDRLFLPFFTTKPTGMGLGLSISKSIIEAHQGRLWAASNPERGITFHFTLPCDLRRSPR